MHSISERIREAKDRISIPALWDILHLPGEMPRGGTGLCRSPFRPDHHPSFSIYEGGRKWKDQASGAGGDAVDFLAEAEGRDRREAVTRFLEIAGTEPGHSARPLRPDHRPKHPDVSFLRMPTDAEVDQIAALRRLDPYALTRAAHLRILRTGTYRGHAVWGLVDGPPGEPPRVAEVRRLDGQPIPTARNPAGVKSLTLAGSRKDWPVGAGLLDCRGKWDALMLCEGLPDWLAALHHAHLAGRFEVLPLSMLGRENKHIHQTALDLTRGLTVRAYPHADPDGGGEAAMKHWLELLPCPAAQAFCFAGLTRRDGKPVKDLNDAAVIAAADRPALSELVPARVETGASSRA